MTGGGSQTVVQSAAPTAEETQLTQQQIELAKAQLEAINRQTAFQEKSFAASGDLLGLQTDLLKETLDQVRQQSAATSPEDQQLLQDLQRSVLQKQLDLLQRGEGATPEQLRAIEEATTSAIAAGQSDISTFAGEATQQLRDELAPALGLRPSDTPILDRGARIQTEATRLAGDLSTRLRGAAQQAALNLPLAQQQVASGVATGAAAVADAAAKFRESLQQAAIMNRLRLSDSFLSNTGTTGQLGLGLATGSGGNIAGTLSALAATRGSTSSTSKEDGTLDYINAGASLAGGIGGLAYGLSFLSDEEAKNVLEVLDDDEVFDRIASLPAAIFEYKHAPGEPHVGTMAQDVQRVFGIGDGRVIPIVDAIGSLFVTAKILAKKLKELEDGGRPEPGAAVDADNVVAFPGSRGLGLARTAA